jgi:F5/8 type C domain
MLNLALNKPTTQSSVYHPETFGYDPHGACNGKKDGKFGFSTLKENEPWWQIDLQGICQLSEIKIFNRMNTGRERSSTLNILISVDAVNWLSCYSNDKENIFGGIDGKPLLVNLSDKIARFVRLQLQENEYFHLDEVEIYGYYLEPNNPEFKVTENEETLKTNFYSPGFPQSELTKQVIQYYPDLQDTNNQLKIYAKNVTSQHGEDGIIERIFEVIGINNSDQWCVEFGAWDGKYLSNTYNLIVNKRWNGVLIEGSIEKFSQISENFTDLSNVYPINTFVGFNDNNNIESILASTSIPLGFGLISIDIDGCDYYVWESIKTYKPKVVVIEYNPSIPNDIAFIQEKDMLVNQGSSLRAFIGLGKHKGYELIAVTETNAIFVLAEEYSKFGIVDNNINKMKKDSGGRIWQGYDGTIFTNNFTSLVWKNRKIDPEELQILPKSERSFGIKFVDPSLPVLDVEEDSSKKK